MTILSDKNVLEIIPPSQPALRNALAVRIAEIMPLTDEYREINDRSMAVERVTDAFRAGKPLRIRDAIVSIGKQSDFRSWMRVNEIAYRHWCCNPVEGRRWEVFNGERLFRLASDEIGRMLVETDDLMRAAETGSLNDLVAEVAAAKAWPRKDRATEPEYSSDNAFEPA